MHVALSDLLLQYLVFIRTIEEEFSEFLWGEVSHTHMHHYLFYGPQGSVAITSHLSAVLEEQTNHYLHVSLNVSTYRHMAAAIGRHLVVGIIDPDEETTTGMDAQAGRLTTTSDRIYGLQNSELGGLTDRLLALFCATSRLWHRKVLGLPVDGHVAELDEILDPRTTSSQLLGEAHPLCPAPTTIHGAPESSDIQKLLKEAMNEHVMPQLHALDQRFTALVDMLTVKRGTSPAILHPSPIVAQSTLPTTVRVPCTASPLPAVSVLSSASSINSSVPVKVDLKGKGKEILMVCS